MRRPKLVAHAARRSGFSGSTLHCLTLLNSIANREAALQPGMTVWLEAAAQRKTGNKLGRQGRGLTPRPPECARSRADKLAEMTRQVTLVREAGSEGDFGQ